MYHRWAMLLLMMMIVCAPGWLACDQQVLHKLSQCDFDKFPNYSALGNVTKYEEWYYTNQSETEGETPTP